jgi:trehalose/maltose transport system permease protein
MEIFTPSLLPKTFRLTNYAAVFQEQPFGQNILNSLIVATLATLVSQALAASASFALARREFAGRGLVLISFLLISMFPQIAVLSGLFEIIRALGLYNRLFGLVLSYMILVLPFTVWVLTTFMRQVPRELEEAAVMDGASSLTILVRIFLPIMAPSLVTAGLLAFVAAWNEFLFAVTFTLSDQARTVPVAIAFMSGSSQHELPWGNIMAAAVVVTIPLILLVLIFQRRIVTGLTAGAVKG